MDAQPFSSKETLLRSLHGQVVITVIVDDYRFTFLTCDLLILSLFLLIDVMYFSYVDYHKMTLIR